MAVEDSVAQDQIRAFIERIERMEAEKAAIASDIKEIYAEAKGNGFDTKILRRVVTIRKQDANERMEQEALLDLYMGALGMISVDYTEQERGERDRLNSLASQVEAGLRKPAADPLAALRADPALAVVDVSNLKSKHQPSQPAGSDLTAPPTSFSQVAPHQPETANETTAARKDVPESAELAGPVQSVDGVPLDPQNDRADRKVEVEAGVEVVTVGRASHHEASPRSNRSEAGTQAPPVDIYAAPGEVTWENHPPEGVERSSYSIAFGNMGQDPVLIQHDLEKGTAQPIVKMGKVIIDGWARYMVACNMRELDGQALSYPVVQYDGTDPLIDVIRWNVEGRTLDDHQKKLIAATLTRQNPDRKDDIYRAFEIFLEPV